MLKIKIAELKRDDVSRELADKYFKSPYGQSIDRMYIPIVDEETYNSFIAEAMKEPKKYGISRISEENKTYSTASKYYKEKISVSIVAKDFGVAPSFIDLKGYNKNPAFYEHYSINVQIAYDMIPYHTPSVRQDIKSSFANEATVDKEMFDQLYNFCSQVIKQYKAMLFSRIDKTMSLLNRIIDETDGFTKNASEHTQKVLAKHYKYYKTLLEDKSFKEYIASHNDVTDFAGDERTNMDFIETYLKLFKDIGLDFTETEEFEKYCPVGADELLNIDFRSFGF